MSNENKKERPTETLTTTNGFKVVMHKWITTQDSDELTDIFTKARLTAKVDIKAQTAEMQGTESDSFVTAAKEARKRAFEMVVVSIDGDKEDLYNQILNMPNEDGTEVFEAVEYITNPKKKELQRPSFDTPQTETSQANS